MPQHRQACSPELDTDESKASQKESPDKIRKVQIVSLPAMMAALDCGHTPSVAIDRGMAVCHCRPQGQKMLTMQPHFLGNRGSCMGFQE